MGCTADVVANGLEVLEALQRIPYDVVFMDCMMPELDGYDAAQRIRQLEDQRARGFESRLPVHIIAMTANAMQGDREKCLLAGMNDYIGKPVRTTDLQRALEAWATNGAGVASETRQAETAAPASEPEPAVDLERLDEITSSDPVKLRRLVQRYLALGEEAFEGLQRAILEGAPKDVQFLAHRFAGASSTCGVAAVLPGLCQLERLGAAGELAGAAEICSETRSRFKQAHSFLTQHMQSLSLKSQA